MPIRCDWSGATFGAYLLKTRYEFCHKVWQQTSRPVNNFLFTLSWLNGGEAG
jgi:hypothetical protein